MRHAGKTAPFRDARGETIPTSIAEASYLRLGGVDQWVMIRGENIANPPLIYLHGGPGFAETKLWRFHNAPLEKVFTAVYWDQRGCGRSYDPKIPRSSMTLEQFLSDLDELVDTVRRRTGKDKVVLYGHSWGSSLGVIYAARHPEKVSAYVGSGQVGDCAAAEAASYAYAVAEAERRNNRKAMQQLREIGPPPYSPEALWTERTWLQRFDGIISPKGLWDFGRAILGGPDFSIAGMRAAMRGFKSSLDALYAESSTINLFDRVPELKMPVFFFLGRKDHFVPPQTSVPYFEFLKAPYKKLVFFEESGHEPFMDEPEKFNRLMAELVRPMVEEGGRRERSWEQEPAQA